LFPDGFLEAGYQEEVEDHETLVCGDGNPSAGAQRGKTFRVANVVGSSVGHEDAKGLERPLLMVKVELLEGHDGIVALCMQ
jgi:hypothetical protein